jgi:hypothetical protein
MPDGSWKRCGAPIRMVPRESAICSMSKDYNRIQIDRADHSKMGKFGSKSDVHYQRVVVQIEEIRK